MKVAIGLPATIPNTRGSTIFEWAQRADSGPFSTLGIIDRIVYPNHEPLITLAAAAAVTRRVRLMPTVLLAPLRQPVLFAKQAVTLDSISNGRLTLGLGIGGRLDDYEAAGADFKERGALMDIAITEIQRVWGDQPVSARVGDVGPRPVQRHPDIILGGAATPALRRAGRVANGWISTPADPHTVEENFRLVREAWREARRPGEPRLLASAYYTLGDAATVERGRGYLLHYYAPNDWAPMVANSMLSTPEAIRGLLDAYRGIGVDEVFLWPCVAELDQVDRLREIVERVGVGR